MKYKVYDPRKEERETLGDRIIGFLLEFKWWILGIPVVIAIFAVLIVAAVKYENGLEARCEEDGGHLEKDTKTFTTTQPDGKGGTTTSTSSDTTYFCLNEEGGILWIE